MSEQFTLSEQPTVTTGRGEQERKKKIEVPIILRDGSKINVMVWDDILDPDKFNEDQRQELFLEEFRRQYKMPPFEIASGILAHLAQGASLASSDEIAGFVEGVIRNEGPEGVSSAIDRQRTVLDKLAMKYPYIATAATTTGTALPVFLDFIFGSKGAASVPLATSTIARSSLYHPLRLSTPTKAPFTSTTVEAATKGGALSAAHEFGAAEGSPLERSQNVMESFNVGAGLGGGLTATLLAATKLPAAWTALKEFGKPALIRKGDQTINKAVQDYASDVYNLGREAPRVLSNKDKRELGRSLFDENIPPSIMFDPLTNPVERPWGNVVGQSNRPILSEGLGMNVFDPVTGMPIRDPQLPSLLAWSSEFNPVEGGVQASRLAQRGMNEPFRIEAALRRSFGPFPFDLSKSLAKVREDSSDVWSAFYRDAYFNPNTKTINTVPLAGSKDIPGSGFIRMFQDDSALYKSIYKQATANRSTAIAHRNEDGSLNWPRHIDGISQQLPTWDMFLSGQRWIPTSTWKDNATALTGKGWTRVKEDGKFLIQDGQHVIANKNKQVEVKTLHDMRIAFDDLIAGDTSAGRKAQLQNARRAFDEKFKSVAPDEMSSADEAFKKWKSTEGAANQGLFALGKDHATADTIRATLEGLTSPIEQRMFLSGFAQELRASNITAEQILSNTQDMRNKIRALFPKGKAGDSAFGNFLAEVSASRRMDQTMKDLGDPSRGNINEARTTFSGHMWNMFAKVPAYHFSAAFAGARDLTTKARSLEKSNNQIIGQHIFRILATESPSELAAVLSRLDREFRSTLPKDAAEIRHIVNLLKTVTAEELDPMHEPYGVSRRKAPGINFATSLIDSGLLSNIEL